VQCSAAAAGTSKQASKQYEEIIVRQKRGRVRVAVALSLSPVARAEQQNEGRVEELAENAREIPRSTPVQTSRLDFPS